MKGQRPAAARQDDWHRFREAGRALQEAFLPYIEGYRALLRKLRAEGFRVRWTCMMAPVQLQGHLPSGEAFYFRCRHSRCSLSIAPKGVDPVTQASWQGEVSRWGQHEAGSLEAEEAEAVFRELLKSYRRDQGAQDRP
jgi:hypothetical protein